VLKKIGIVLAVVVVSFIVVIALQPSEFRIERSRKIEAPGWVVFNHVNNLQRWSRWSPWEKLDPNMEKKHSGPEAGVGAIYEWSGNDQVGTGRMTIEESVVPEKVGIKLEFLEPFEATNQTTFTFLPEGQGVKVTWAMEGHNGFFAKAFSLFNDMDAMVGKDFETGLAELDKMAVAEWAEIQKAKAEEAKKTAAATAATPIEQAPAE
jgi:hypothetical protein